MNRHGTKGQKKAASAISAKLKDKFACDIALDAKIGPCLHIPHHMGIVITSRAHIGAHCIIRQNTTLGGTVKMGQDEFMSIGDNVDLGANSCLVGPITIGDNAVIGAMSFVNKDIPANTIFVNPRICNMRPVPESFERMAIPRFINRRA
ncbi:serine acetyltransferase [Pseudocitrobacter cyperus]|uniref:DapH/DapD/GlmU-related protein n=1 Tax=Pseudocitrobacter cyperus TaxID=3112843 RepID=A0ABV0HFC9_9ENTR